MDKLLDIDPALWKAAKIRAADEEIPLKKWVAQAIEEKLKRKQEEIMRQAVIDQLEEPLTPAEEAAVQIAMQLQDSEARFAKLFTACQEAANKGFDVVVVG